MGYLNSAPESIVCRLIKGESCWVSILKVFHRSSNFDECRMEYSKTYHDVKELLWYHEGTVRAQITQFQGVSLRMRISLAAFILWIESEMAKFLKKMRCPWRKRGHKWGEKMKSQTRRTITTRTAMKDWNQKHMKRSWVWPLRLKTCKIQEKSSYLWIFVLVRSVLLSS